MSYPRHEVTHSSSAWDGISAEACLVRRTAHVEQLDRVEKRVMRMTCEERLK